MQHQDQELQISHPTVDAHAYYEAPGDADEGGKLSIGDIVFMLYRQKWKIIFFTMIGLAAAGYLYFEGGKSYRSEAKLLVRYVFEWSPVDPGATNYDSPDPRGTLLNTELQILRSWDLAEEVAEKVGVERLSGDIEPPLTARQAAGVVLRGLTTTYDGDIIALTYKHQDPDLAVDVLRELIGVYKREHLRIHRSTGAFEFVMQQSDQVRYRLQETEQKLNLLRRELGVANIDVSINELTIRLGRLQDELYEARSDRASVQARIEALKASGVIAAESLDTSSESPETQAVVQGPSQEEASRYMDLTDRIEQLRERKKELTRMFTEESNLVVSTQRQIVSLEKDRNGLLEKFPGLALESEAGTSGGMSQGASERIRLAELEARINILEEQVLETQQRLDRISDSAMKIADLERRKEVEESSYRYLEESLEKSRIGDAIDPSKMPNIDDVQSPTPPVLKADQSDKVLLMLAGGGFGIGLGLALFIELILDRRIKRPVEIERHMRMPLLLTIPKFKTSGSVPRLAHRQVPAGQPEATAALVAKERQRANSPGHLIRPYVDAIRDRLAYYFEVNNMTHRPKLIGVTGLAGGSGRSTLAAGLACSLAESLDDQFLLVDLNPYDANAAPLENLPDNLSVARACGDSSGIGLPNHMTPQKMSELLPRFRASHYAYIIFDMPLMGPTSPTVAMAGFLDKVLLVLDGATTDKLTLKKNYDELVRNHADVSCVMNKSQDEAPAWLQGLG